MFGGKRTSRMSERLQLARSYHAAIREVLLREWDPIGVADISQAADEYDSYISQVHGLLIRREPLYKLIDFLWWVETDHMGLAGNRRRTEQVAERLLRLPEEIASSAERGVWVNEVGRDGVTGRPLFLLDAATLDDIPAALAVPGPHFVCLLAWDARGVSVAVIGAVAERLLRAGCAYICCWGPDCERVHDIFDESDLHLRPHGPWCMSTWHSDEPLAEAIWFALFSAWPDGAFADGCRSVVGVSVGSPEWGTELRAAFAAPGEFSVRQLGNVQDAEPDTAADGGGTIVLPDS